jgi:hypothetical protein
LYWSTVKLLKLIDDSSNLLVDKVRIKREIGLRIAIQVQTEVYCDGGLIKSFI